MVSDWNAGWGWAIEQMWAPHGVLIDIDPLTKKQIVYSKHMSAINERKGDGVDADNFSRKYDVRFSGAKLKPIQTSIKYQYSISMFYSRRWLTDF